MLKGCVADMPLPEASLVRVESSDIDTLMLRCGCPAGIAVWMVEVWCDLEASLGMVRSNVKASGGKGTASFAHAIGWR